MTIFTSAVFLLCAALEAQETVAVRAKRVIETNCVSCHGGARMGGLDLRTREGALAGGKRGAALKPGDVAGSLLYQAVLRNGELQMPPGKKVSFPASTYVNLRHVVWVEEGELVLTEGGERQARLVRPGRDRRHASRDGLHGADRRAGCRAVPGKRPHGPPARRGDAG